jgi:phosphatidylglycerol:prolipoprotein diacylglycerol transferase
MFEAIEFGPFIVWTHLAFLLLAVWMGSEFFFRLAQSAGLSLQGFKEKALWHMAAFLIAGRIIAMIAEYRVYLRDPLRIFIFWDGNFSYLGGAIGIAVALFYLKATSRTTFLQWLDVLLPATTFGLAFDWLGKFASGQAYGKPTDMPWGVIYDAINVRYVVPIHPVQLYYAVFFFILTFVLLVVRKNSKRAGAETLAGIVLAATATILFESFRGDFGIPVFATSIDFAMLLALFGSLGVFAAVELNISQRTILIYEAATTVVCAGYIFLRPWLPLATHELRFSQLLSILALLGAVVYVVVHRRLYPHL